MRAFGERLKLLRLEKGLTQEEFGKIFSKTKNNISQYERGERSPDFDTLSEMADFFNTTSDYLLGKSELRRPRVITVEELKEFLPTEVVEKNKITVQVDELEISEETKAKIKEVLREEGYLK